MPSLVVWKLFSASPCLWLSLFVHLVWQTALSFLSTYLCHLSYYTDFHSDFCSFLQDHFTPLTSTFAVFVRLPLLLLSNSSFLFTLRTVFLCLSVSRCKLRSYFFSSLVPSIVFRPNLWAIPRVRDLRLGCWIVFKRNSTLSPKIKKINWKINLKFICSIKLILIKV